MYTNLKAMKQIKLMLNHIHRRELVIMMLSFFVAIVWVVSIRFVTLKSDAVHYHANFAIFVDGERISFDNPLNFEEVQLCGGDETMNPKSRVHMHDFVDHVLHVHDSGATWGHFFANIGMTNGDRVFRIDSDVYVDGKDTDISFILNGETVDTTANRAIQSEDILLVSIGKTNESELKEQYKQVENDAGEYNQRDDPSSCSGGKQATFSERFKHAITIF